MDIQAERSAPHYKAVSTYHLNDRNLSLGAKGLLTMMLCYQKKGLNTAVFENTCKETSKEIDALIDEIAMAGYATVHERDVVVAEKPSAKAKPVRQKKCATFTPPTLDEIAAYVKEKGYHFDPEEFFHHYDANNWHVGKVKVSRWKSCCFTWEKNWLKEHPGETNYSDWE